MGQIDWYPYSQAIPWNKTRTMLYLSHTYIGKAEYSTVLGALIKRMEEIQV